MSAAAPGGHALRRLILLAALPLFLLCAAHRWGRDLFPAAKSQWRLALRLKRQPADVGLAGTSLSGTIRPALQGALHGRRFSPRLLMGGRFADMWSFARRECRNGTRLVFLELNSCYVNWRPRRFTQGQTALKAVNAAPLLPFLGWREMANVVAEGGIQRALAEWAAAQYFPAWLGDREKPAWRDWLRRRLLGGVPRPAPDNYDWPQITRAVFRDKNLAAGVDSRVVAAFLRWGESSGYASRIVVYLPPLNREFICASCGRAADWLALRRWHAELGRQCAAHGFRFLDLTELLETGAFRDYGHLAGRSPLRGPQRVAAALAAFARREEERRGN